MPRRPISEIESVFLVEQHVLMYENTGEIIQDSYWTDTYYSISTTKRNSPTPMDTTYEGGRRRVHIISIMQVWPNIRNLTYQELQDL